MLLSALALLFISVLISRYRLLGTHVVMHLMPLLIGAAVAGLLLLARYEETSTSLAALRRAGFAAIREQTFHDAGLLLFYYSTLVFLILAGTVVLVLGVGWLEKTLGMVIAALAPVSFLLMTTTWPAWFDLGPAVPGLKQRAALFCLWLAIIFLLIVAAKPWRQAALAKTAPKIDPITT